MKRLLAFLFSVCMLFCLVACVANTTVTDESDDVPSTEKNTSVNTEESTSEEEKVNTGTPSGNNQLFNQPVVIDATDYEKKVIPVRDDYDPDWMHRVCIPKLSSSSANATEFNQNIFEKYVIFIDTLKNNEEKNYIYDISYEFKVYESVVGISMDMVFAPQNAGFWHEYDFYYYDLKNDREITFEEYLQILGTNKKAVLENMEHSATYKDIEESLTAHPQLLHGIFDDQSAHLLIKGVEWLDTDTVCFQFDENLI